MDEYVWDHRNRLNAMIFKDDMNNVLAVVENKYDYLNRWVEKIYDADGAGGSNPVSTHFVYDAYQVVLQFDDSDATSAATDGDLSHVYFWSDKVDFLLSDEKIPGTNVIIWAALDHLNTPRDLVVGTSTYNHRVIDTFGTLLSQTNATYASSITFTGKMFDVTMGLGYYVNRWYDSKVGRWVSEDPIGFEAGTNFAVYVENQPTSFSDPSGLIGEDWIFTTQGGYLVRIIVPGLGSFEGPNALQNAASAAGIKPSQLGPIIAQSNAQYSQVTGAYVGDVPFRAGVGAGAAGTAGTAALGTTGTATFGTLTTVGLPITAAVVAVGGTSWTLYEYYKYRDRRSDYVEDRTKAIERQGIPARRAATLAESEAAAWDKNSKAAGSAYWYYFTKPCWIFY